MNAKQLAKQLADNPYEYIARSYVLERLDKDDLAYPFISSLENMLKRDGVIWVLKKRGKDGNNK